MLLQTQLECIEAKRLQALALRHKRQSTERKSEPDYSQCNSRLSMAQQLRIESNYRAALQLRAERLALTCHLEWLSDELLLHVASLLPPLSCRSLLRCACKAAHDLPQYPVLSSITYGASQLTLQPNGQYLARLSGGRFNHMLRALKRLPLAERSYNASSKVWMLGWTQLRALDAALPIDLRRNFDEAQLNELERAVGMEREWQRQQIAARQQLVLEAAISAAEGSSCDSAARHSIYTTLANELNFACACGVEGPLIHHAETLVEAWKLKTAHEEAAKKIAEEKAAAARAAEEAATKAAAAARAAKVAEWYRWMQQQAAVAKVAAAKVAAAKVAAAKATAAKAAAAKAAAAKAAVAEAAAAKAAVAKAAVLLDAAAKVAAAEAAVEETAAIKEAADKEAAAKATGLQSTIIAAKYFRTESGKDDPLGVAGKTIKVANQQLHVGEGWA